jgi:hypothetical protein
LNIRRVREPLAFITQIDPDGATFHAFNVWTYGAIEIPVDFMGLNRQAPFAGDRAVRDELRRRINQAVPQARIPPEEQRRRPSFLLTAVADETVQRGFLGAVEWAFKQAHTAQAQQQNVD